MEIYLVRHTSVEVTNKICYGQSDVELADGYSTDLKRIRAKDLLPESIDSCYSSPLNRCRILAEDLYQKPVIFDNRLKELNFGDWEMTPWDDLSSSEFREWTDDYINKQCPNGESYDELVSRVLEFWRELTTGNYRNALVITHNGCLLAILSHLLQIPLQYSFRLGIDYGGVSKVTLHEHPEYITVNYINR